MRTFTSRLWDQGAMRSPTTPLRSLIPGYFNARHDLSPKAQRSYTDMYLDFDRWCASRPAPDARPANLADLVPETVEAYVAHRMRHGVRPGVTGSEHQAGKAAVSLKSLATFFAARLWWHDGRGGSLLATVRIPQSDAQRARLSNEDMVRILRAVETSSFPERDRTVLFLIAGNGPREKELVRLRLRDYDRATGILTIPANATKGRPGRRRERALPLDEFVRPQLDHYLDEHRVGPDDPDAALITTRRGQPFTEQGLYQVFKRLKSLSGVQALCPHALRHYWTEHYDGDLTDLMIEGGWNSVAMVKRYRGNRARDRSRTSTLANALSFTPKRRSSRQGDGFRLLHATRAG